MINLDDVLIQIEEKVHQALLPILARMDRIEKKINFIENYCNGVVRVFVEKEKGRMGQTLPISNEQGLSDETRQSNELVISSQELNNSRGPLFFSVDCEEVLSSGVVVKMESYGLKVIQGCAAKFSSNHQLKHFTNIKNKNQNNPFDGDPLTIAKQIHDSDLEGVQKVCESYNSTDWFSVQCKIVYTLYNHIKFRKRNREDSPLEATRKEIRLLSEKEPEDHQEEEQEQQEQRGQQEQIREKPRKETEEDWKKISTVNLEVLCDIKRSSDMMKYIESSKTSPIDRARALVFAMRKPSMKEVLGKIKNVEGIHLAALFERIVERNWEDLLKRLIRFSILFQLWYLGKKELIQENIQKTINNFFSDPKKKKGTSAWEILLHIHQKFEPNCLTVSLLENLIEVNKNSKFTPHEKYLFYLEKNSLKNSLRHQKLLKVLHMEDFDDYLKEKSNIDEILN